MRKFLTGIVLLTTGLCSAQTFSDKIIKEYTFERKTENNAMLVANISGDVTVQGYAGDKIIIEITRTIHGKTKERLEQGIKAVQLGVIDNADTLIFFVETECNNFGRKTKRGGGKWGYNWDSNEGNWNNCRTPYEYTMDFVIRVPASLHINVSTINDGDVVVSQVKGVVEANNVNGSVKLSNLSREAVATTINGNVDIDYDRNPGKACRFYSLNGDINALFQKGLAANLSFESFNGEFFSNIDTIERLPSAIVQAKKGEGIKYKVKDNRYKVGNGGALLDFETFNGNVYLKEKL